MNLNLNTTNTPTTIHENFKNHSFTILRLPDVLALTGLSRSSIYLRVSYGLFPKPISLGGRAVGWPEHEILAITAAWVAGKSNEEIANLVHIMLAKRRNEVSIQAR